MHWRPDNLEVLIGRLATLLFEKYERVLLGDLHQIDALAKEDTIAQREMQRTYRHGPTLRAADEAWKERDYQRVVVLLGSLEEGWLNLGELRRLEYARRHTKCEP